MSTEDADETRDEPDDGAPEVDDDSMCWVCGAPVIKRHCKIVCPRCGFMRDCSDP